MKITEDDLFAKFSSKDKVNKIMNTKFSIKGIEELVENEEGGLKFLYRENFEVTVVQHMKCFLNDPYKDGKWRRTTPSIFVCKTKLGRDIDLHGSCSEVENLAPDDVGKVYRICKDSKRTEITEIKLHS